MDLIAQNIEIEVLYCGGCGNIYREVGAVFSLDFLENIKYEYLLKMGDREVKTGLL